MFLCHASLRRPVLSALRRSALARASYQRKDVTPSRPPVSVDRRPGQEVLCDASLYLRQCLALPLVRDWQEIRPCGGITRLEGTAARAGHEARSDGQGHIKLAGGSDDVGGISHVGIHLREGERDALEPRTKPRCVLETPPTPCSLPSRVIVQRKSRRLVIRSAER